jgi:uncharacterized protein
MTNITPMLPEGRQVIQSYGDGGFRVAGVQHPGSVIVFAERTVPWHAQALAEASIENLGAVTTAGTAVRLLLIGAGRGTGLLDATLRRHLRASGVVCEVMDTGAACRTFNVLLAEERQVAAALIATT